ncbi:hypothetical protein FA15DRAFT_610509 [Coprinopsis marcescibilis]|uniref:Nucleoporin Nup120/160-domain-containing protein n=1 Tax=Coprinopsis marcescibilis TaxID=230819 RepID=A0A5C3L8I8_COPMA|nr:hypothetical protein FA15DRAFT_610509 [Coprinopsis marcescibilis]
MDEFIVATHITSVVPYPPSTVTIQTARQHLPLPQTLSNSIPTEHAIFASTIDHEATGTVLLRLIHGGLIIELSSLSTSIQPLRLVFPSLVLDSPAVFLWEDDELHVLAVTESGSLYRVVIPVQGRNLWKHDVENVWPREYLITNFPDSTEGPIVHVHGPYCIAVSLKNGSLLRLEADSLGYDSRDEEWTESVFHHGSFLSSITSFIPTLHSSQPNSADIVSITTYDWLSDIGHIWTLSRDRTLRLWKAKQGCIASKALPSVPHSLDHSRASSASGSNHPSRNHPLLDEVQQNLIRVFSKNDRIYVLAFVPTQSSVTSGGFFCVIDTATDQLFELSIIECSKRTVHRHLQDFIIQPGQSETDKLTLITLWDSQGRSCIEKTALNLDSLEDQDAQPHVWTPAIYPKESELTPAYMEEKLLTPGSLAETFLENIFKPGMFSSLSLRTAIDQYTDACLTLPGPPPPQLMATYTTLCENVASVVGCTVILNRDPQSGAFQYSNYWTALKRDWEGFVARCREVERSARWPLSLGTRSDNKVVILERERAATLVLEDMPIHFHRLITQGHQINDQSYDILAISGALRLKIGPEVMSAIESRVIDLVHQEAAFSLVDMLLDLAVKLEVKEYLEDFSWFKGRLERVGNLDQATRTAVDTIGGLDFSAKREEDEMDLTSLIPSSQSEWTRSLTAGYISAAVGARYQLSLSLITLLVFLSEELSSWDPNLLAEVFALFRGAAMLHYVSSMPAEKPSILADEDSGSVEDEVLSRLRNMDVSQTRVPLSAPTSLIHHLLAQSAAAGDIHIVAHNFLDNCGLLQSVSPAYATKFEVAFCERLRLLQAFDVARELLSYLPRTAATTFVLAQIWLQIGRFDDAAQLFERLAGCFGGDTALAPDDAEALTLVLPAAHAIGSDFLYYIHASELFKRHYLVHYEAHFAELAVSVAPPGSDTSGLRTNIVRGYASLSMYEEAYAALMMMPYDKLKRELASQLALQMCEADAVARLMKFDFAGIADEVEAVLSFKTRNSDPRLPPNFSRILYTWYIQRGEYRNAALTMYQRALKLQEIITNTSLFLALGEEQLDTYSIAINALALVDENSQWVTVPIVSDLHKRKKPTSKYIPESRFISSKHGVEVVHLKDMRGQHTLLAAQIDIIKREPDILNSPEFLLPPPVIVLRLAHNNLINQALNVASSLNVDMTDLFIKLTTQCIHLSKSRNSQPVESDWLLTDNASTWIGSPSDRGWKFLRQSLSVHDGPDTDYRYAKAAFETVLSIDRGSPPPPWLEQILENHHPECLIRLALRYDNIDDAVSYSLSLLKKSDARLARESSQNASLTWFPYALVDQVIGAASSSPMTHLLLPKLQSDLNSRLKRVHKLSQKPV